MKQKDSRIIFGYRGENYKFANFFVDKRDNSFYFRLYRKPNESPMKYEEENGSRIHHIHFPSFTPTGFNENKMSFHESGVIHSTDQHGTRYHDGFNGIPFRDVKSCLFILALAPKNPEDMIRLEQIDSSRDIHIGLKDDVEPFVLQFAIHRKNSYPLPTIPTSENILGGYVCCEYDHKDFGLLIAMTRVGRLPGVKTVDWPPFTLVLKRTG